MGHLYNSQLREVRTSIKSIYDKKVRPTETFNLKPLTNCISR